MHLFENRKKRFVFTCLLVTALTGSVKAQRPELPLPLGHQQGVTCLDFSKDGNLLCTGSGDNSFIVWDARTGFVLRRVKTAGRVEQVLLIPGDTQLITLIKTADIFSAGTQKATVQKWDLKTGKMLQALPFTTSGGLQFLQNGNYLLVPGYSTGPVKNEPDHLTKMKIQWERAEKDDDYEDSLDQEIEERVKKRMGITDEDQLSPEKAQAYFKAVTAEVMKVKFGLNPFKSPVAVVDANTLQPVSFSDDLPKGQTLLRDGGIEYLLTWGKDLFSTGSETKIAIREIKDFISQSRQKKTAAAAKEWVTKMNVETVVVAPAKGYFATTDGINVQLWQLEKGLPAANLKAKGEVMRSLQFSSDGNLLYAFSGGISGQFLEVWNTTTLKPMVATRLPDRYTGVKMSLSPAGDYVVVADMTGLVKMSVQGDSLGQFKGRSHTATRYVFANNDREVRVAYNGYPDIEPLMRMAYEKGAEDDAKQQGLSQPEKDRRVKQNLEANPFVTFMKSIRRFALSWDLTKGGTTLVAYENTGSGATVSADNRYSLSNEKTPAAGQGFARNMAFITQNMHEATEEEKKDIQAIQGIVNPNTELGKLLTADSVNGPVTLLINRKTRDTVSLISIDSADWLMLLKNGYYMTSQNGARSLSYSRGLEVLPFEQSDIRNNRPDLVLKAIDLADTALIRAYYRAYQKRMQKLEIGTLQLKDDANRPESKFEDKEKIEFDQKTEKLSLTVVANGAGTFLSRMNVWINDVPLFGKAGKSLKERRTSTLRHPVDVILSQGLNRIEASVINANGTESYRIPLFVKYTPAQPRKEAVYFIGIGIDRFADTAYNLRYCSKDIRDLALRLKERYSAGLQMDTLFNENVTVERVKAIKQKLLQSREDDKVIIAYSGHGLLSKDYDYYLSTYNVNFIRPEQNGLPYEELENLADGIRARRKLLLIDACHSGELDKEEMQKIAGFQAEQAKNNKVVGINKGIKLPANNRVGLKNSFELMQQLFVNVSKSTGTTVLSAAAGTQFALEMGDIQNGVFTYSIMELLKPGKSVTVGELKAYVSQRVVELTKGLQQPTSRNETVNNDWRMW